MKLNLNKSERDVIILHLVFVGVCLLVILIPIGLPIGIRLLILVIIYNLLVVIFGTLRNYKEWINIWLFSFILSIFQIFPDWILSAELEILVFPEDGLFKIGSVSGYMLGLWAIPLFIILFVGQRLQERYSKKSSYLIVAILALLIFGGSENSMWMLQSWYAQNVTMLGHLAIYIIIPEIILGLSAFYAYDLIKENYHWFKVPVTFIIMLLYIGSAVFFYFLIEKIIIT